MISTALQPEDAPERDDRSCSRFAEAACSGYWRVHPWGTEQGGQAGLGWTDAAAKQIAEAKAAELGGGSSTGSETAGSGSGSGSQSGGSTDTGGNNQGGSGSTIPGEGD